MSNILTWVIMFSGTWTLVGIIFLAIGLVMLYNIRKTEKKCTSMTYGKVIDIIDLHTSYSYNNRRVTSNWHQVFGYTVGENDFKKISTFGSSKSEFSIGQDVTVYYNPENYSECYVVEETLPKKIATIATFIGIGGISTTIISVIFTLILTS